MREIKDTDFKNNISKAILILAAYFAVFFSLGSLSSAKAALLITERLAGKILLQVESKGEAWYVNPEDLKRYYLGKPADAFNIMRDLGLGISEKDYQKLENNGNKTAARLAGKILLRVEKKGEAYYVNPLNLGLNYLGKPKDAFELMKKQGLGITDEDLEKIEAGGNNFPTSSVAAEDTKPPSTSSPQQNTGQALEGGGTSAFIEKPCDYANGCEEYKGVKIKWIVDEDTFPPEWVADKERINPSAESLTDKDQIERSVRVIKKAMDKYPEYFFTEKKYLETIYVVGELSTFNKGCSGTYTTFYKKIYISGFFNENELSVFEQTFHHEYSSFLLWLNFRLFPTADWDNINPFEFKYNNEYNWGGLDEKFAQENGFLENYSKTSRENDFNNIAEQLFREEDIFLGGDFWHIAEEYPKIRQKVDIVIDFYHKLDPIFTEEYFRKIGEE